MLKVIIKNIFNLQLTVYMITASFLLIFNIVCLLSTTQQATKADVLSQQWKHLKHNQDLFKVNNKSPEKIQ